MSNRLLSVLGWGEASIWKEQPVGVIGLWGLDVPLMLLVPEDTACLHQGWLLNVGQSGPGGGGGGAEGTEAPTVTMSSDDVAMDRV